MLLPALLGAYLLATLAVTAVVRIRHGAQRERHLVFVAGGTLSGFVTGCTLCATAVGGSSIVVATALVYQHGLPGIWLDLSGALGFLALGLLLARRVRETGVASIAELAGLRHGPGVRRLCALVVLCAELGWLALQARAAADVLGPSFPTLAPALLMAVALGWVALYTLAGGQLAVSYLDVVQLALMALGLCVLAPLATTRALGAGGLAGLRLEFPTSASFGAPEILGFLALTGLPHMVGSDIYAKILSARDGRAARRGALLGAAFKALFGLALGLTALAGRELLPGLAAPGELLPSLLARVLPPAIAGLVIVAVLATMQSTASQVLLSATTMLGNDLLPRPGVARVATPLLAGLAWLLAVVVPTVVDLMKIAYTVFAAGLALPVVTAVLPGLRLPRAAVAAAIACGSGLGGGLHALRLAGLAPLPGDPVLWGAGACLLCLAAGALRPPRDSISPS